MIKSLLAHAVKKGERFSGGDLISSSAGQCVARLENDGDHATMSREQAAALVAWITARFGQYHVKRRSAILTTNLVAATPLIFQCMTTLCKSGPESRNKYMQKVSAFKRRC